MRYLKIYENYQTEAEVDKICKKYGIKNWFLNKDGLVDVDGDVDLSNMLLKKLPVKFGEVTGGFLCDNNDLTTLVGAPHSVDDNFFCFDNNLFTLEGGPKTVGGEFSCSSNQLTTLKGAPETVVGGFYCHNNQLTTLEGAPETVGGSFICWDNPLTGLIKDNLKHIKHIIANQDIYKIYNPDGSINGYRFQLMMDSMD